MLDTGCYSINRFCGSRKGIKKPSIRCEIPVVGHRVSKTAPYILFCLLVFTYGCSVSSPTNYYEQVLEIEEYGEEARRDSGRSPGEIVESESEPELINIEKPPVVQLESDEPEPEEETSVVDEREEAQEPETQAENIREEEKVREEPPRRELVKQEEEAVVSLVPLEPVAVASGVIKTALNAPELGVNVRAAEAVNGRLSGGKNSVRVNFASDSLEEVVGKFITICAVIYHLDKGSRTIDVIVGIAEDRQSNLLAIFQSNMSDITAWMTNEITRSEWYSRVTKKAL